MKFVFLIKNLASTIRILNLGIICFSLLLVRYTVVFPILKLNGHTSSVSDRAFLVLLLAAVLIAAAGYVINDYFDFGIDAINKPGKNKLNSFFSRGEMMSLYWSLNLSGLLAGWYFGYLLGIHYPMFLFFACSGLLYFYSTSFKKMLITGNLVIALLSALILALPVIFDSVALHFSPIPILITAYVIFAFMLTLIREIIKDIEDMNGDAAFGATTLPVMAGAGISRMICTMLTLVTSATILYIQIGIAQWDNLLSFCYTILFIQVPLLFLTWRIYRAKNKADDHRNSNVSKFIMVTGLLSMLVFYLTS